MEVDQVTIVVEDCFETRLGCRKSLAVGKRNTITTRGRPWVWTVLTIPRLQISIRTVTRNSLKTKLTRGLDAKC